MGYMTRTDTRDNLHGRVKIVLSSATEALEELTLRAGFADNMEEICGSVELLMLQLERELIMWHDQGR